MLASLSPEKSTTASGCRRRLGSARTDWYKRNVMSNAPHMTLRRAQRISHQASSCPTRSGRRARSAPRAARLSSRARPRAGLCHFSRFEEVQRS
jgi:hypothetical protein